MKTLGIGWHGGAASDPCAARLFYGESAICTYDGWHEICIPRGSRVAPRRECAGDRIGIFMDNHPDWLLGFTVILYAGAVAFRQRKAAWAPRRQPLPGDSGARLCPDGMYTCVEFERGGAYAPQPPLWAFWHWTKWIATARRIDMAWLFYTSGTTGAHRRDDITMAC